MTNNKILIFISKREFSIYVNKLFPFKHSYSMFAPNKCTYTSQGSDGRTDWSSRCKLTFHRELLPPLWRYMLLLEPRFLSHYRTVYSPVNESASSCHQPPIIVL